MERIVTAEEKIACEMLADTLKEGGHHLMLADWIHTIVNEPDFAQSWDDFHPSHESMVAAAVKGFVADKEQLTYQAFWDHMAHGKVPMPEANARRFDTFNRLFGHLVCVNEDAELLALATGVVQARKEGVTVIDHSEQDALRAEAGYAILGSTSWNLAEIVAKVAMALRKIPSQVTFDILENIYD